MRRDIRSVLAAVVAIAAAAVLLAVGAGAEAPAIRVLASNGVQGAWNELVPDAERSVGHPLNIEFGTTAALRKRIEGGEVFDLTVLTTEAIDALVQEGKLAANSRVNAARAGIGVGVRAGSAKPAVNTPETLKKSLLEAKSITYAEAGASRPAIDKMLASMGIADQVKSKTLLLPGADQTSAAVSSGKAEILLTLISEIMSAKGLALAGPLPKEYQSYVAFAAAVSASSKNPQAAKAAVRFLTGPKAAAAYKAKGMEPIH